MENKSVKIILDFGSGNTCKNDKRYIKRMYDELEKVNSGKHEVIVKWQLFKRAGKNIPLTEEAFEYAYDYGKQLGYDVTASVHDQTTLKFLLMYDIPFVKLANRRELDYLVSYIPEEVPLYISKTQDLFLPERKENKEELWCISQYPARLTQYLQLPIVKGCNISDHTEDFRLFFKFEPKIIEWHYKLKDSTGLDAGEFAKTPEQLKEIL